MKILHLDSSINDEFSVTRQLSGEIVRRLSATAPGSHVVYRDLVKDEVGHLTADIAAGFRPVAGSSTPDALTQQHQLSDTLVTEFLQSDVVVIGAPMYNFSVSSQLKAWMDRIAQPGKTFSYTANGPVGLAGAKSVIIASARGGFYYQTALEEMDFQERFLRSFLGFLGITQVAFVRAEGISKGQEIKEREIERALSAISQAITAVSNQED